jgi:hypothetical protein
LARLAGVIHRDGERHGQSRQATQGTEKAEEAETDSLIRLLAVIEARHRAGLAVWSTPKLVNRTASSGVVGLACSLRDSFAVAAASRRPRDDFPVGIPPISIALERKRK